MSGSSSACIGDLTLRMEPGFACSKAHLIADGIPHLRPFNVGRDGRLNLREVYQIPLSAVPRGRGLLSAGEILFNNTNSDDLVGKSALIEETMTAGFSNHMTRVVVDSRRAEPGYVAYALDRLWHSGYFRRICTRWVNQSAVNTKALAEVQIPLPALGEQRRIVDILDRAASIRRLRRQAQDTARQIVPALFNKMLGNPEQNPRGWPVRLLGTVLCEPPRNGLSPARTGIYSDRVLTLSAITHGSFDATAVKDAKFARPVAPRERVSSQDFLITRGNGNLELVGRGEFPTSNMPLIAFPDTIIAVRPNQQELCPDYLSAFWNTSYARRYLAAKAQTTNGTFKLNQTAIVSIPIMLPPLETQQAFAQLASNITRSRELESRAGVLARAVTGAIESQMFSA